MSELLTEVETFADRERFGSVTIVFHEGEPVRLDTSTKRVRRIEGEGKKNPSPSVRG